MGKGSITRQDPDLEFTREKKAGKTHGNVAKESGRTGEEGWKDLE